MCAQVNLGQLFRSPDPIRTFLDAYAYCRKRQLRIFNLFQEETHNETYISQKKELQEKLGTGADLQQLIRTLGSVDDDPTVIRVSALATALATHISKTEGSKLSRYFEPYENSAGERFWLAIESPGAFGGRINNPPRNLDELHWTLLHLHHPLLITPAKLEEWSLARISLDADLENWLEHRLKGGSFCVAVSPLSYHAKFRAGTPLPGASQPSFYLEAMEREEEQLKSLKAVLQQASHDGVSILVLPELRIPETLLQETKKFLHEQTLTMERGLLLVVAGSWHVPEGTGHRNRCFVLNHHGEMLWKHDKLVEYEITPDNVREAPGVFGQIGVGAEGARENIYRGSTLEFYESVIGRVAVAICIGFFSPHVEPLLQGSQANIFLVPTMTPSIADLKDRARALVRNQRACTFVANCGYVGNHKALSFYQLASKKQPALQELAEGKSLLLFEVPPAQK